MKLKLENWYLLPTELQKIDTILSKGDTLTTEVIIQANNYFDLSLNEQPYKLFAAPGSSTVFNYSPEGMTFSGAHSSINQFLEQLIKKHHLKMLNLFAAENWNEKLYRAFAISSLPHSTLVDREGKFVQNNCLRASQGIAQQINQLLKDRN